MLVKSVVSSVVLFVLCCANAHAYDPKATIASLDAKLTSLGQANVQGSDKLGDKNVPGLYFGTQKINHSVAVVDEIRKEHWATATVFVKSGQEFVRVSTNVTTPDGKRGTGTELAHNKAYEALSHGQSYCGVIYVLGTAFDACYNPIKDAKGQTIGASYIGHRK